MKKDYSYKIKSCINIFYYVTFSLLSIFLSLRFISYIDIPQFFKNRPKNGCWELDHCDLSPWYSLLLFAVLFLPVVFSAIVGYKNNKKILSSSSLRNFFSIFLITLIVHLIFAFAFELFSTQ